MHHIKCLLPLLVGIALGVGGAGASRAVAQEAGGIGRLDVPLEATVPLQMSDKQTIKSMRSENASVATVTVKIDDPKTALVKGVRAGFTRITLTDTNNKSESYEVFVGKTGDQLRTEFLSLARRAVPTSGVDVIPSGATVIITGTVTHAADIQVIMGIARGLFPGANIINGMRVGGVQQVQLDVVIAQVNRTVARSMGFNFAEFGLHHFLTSFPGTAFSPLAFAGNVAATAAAGTGNLSSTGFNGAFGIVNDKQGFLGFINALRAESIAKVMAMPVVTTLTGRPAYIIDGGQVPYVATSLQGANVNYLPFGTVVQILPIVLGDGKIHLEVNSQFSTPDNALSITVGGTNPVSAPGFDMKKVRSAVRLEDGQTLAIGGLIQNKINGQTFKLPILGDLPYIGAAFRNVTYTDNEEELLMLVTPRLVDPMSCDQLPKLLPGQETRSPDDFELFLEGILEAPRGQRVVGIRNYTAAYHNSPSTQLYPCMNPPGTVPPPLGGHGGAALVPIGTPAATPTQAPPTLPANLNEVSPISAAAPQDMPAPQENLSGPVIPQAPLTIDIPVGGDR
jgi:pilus assembly protein CpaC